LDYFPLFILGVLLGKGERRTNKGDGEDEERERD